MGKKNPEVDSYIADAPAFAQPILKRLRSAFHKGCPDIVESIKWGIPCFEYEGIVGSMAAFKEHVGLGFWKSKLMKDPHGLLARRAASMCNTRFEKLKDVPKVSLIAEYVEQAVELNVKAKAKGASKKRAPKKPAPKIPPDLKTALSKSKKAKTVFDTFAPSHKRDYIEWITEAKREETRDRRVAQTIEWLKEGKTRNWKYETKR